SRFSRVRSEEWRRGPTPGITVRKGVRGAGGGAGPSAGSRHSRSWLWGVLMRNICRTSGGLGTYLVLAALAFVGAAGCGPGAPKAPPVRGKVVFKEDGKPLTGGAVRFESAAEPKVVAWGEIQRNGTFSLTTYKEGDGAVAGEHQALIEPPEGDETKVRVHP